NYTLRFVDKTPYEEWFRQPPAGVTHIAWQVGHIAMGEYRLLLERMRGRQPDDLELISDEFLQLFGKGSEPAAVQARYPSPEVIRAVFDHVHQKAIEGIAALNDADLDAPLHKPHSLIQTKAQALWYCPMHEMIHAGQIALVRRFLGHPPAW